MKFLLDENLSPRLTSTLAEVGLDVVHVRDRGLLSASDALVFSRAFGEDRVLVTRNYTDFRPLARSTQLHPGIVALRDGEMPLDLLRTLLQGVLLRLSASDLVNRIAYVEADGEISYESIPADSP
jgi:predicted nuclease of predicted toxin-antitoxin system